MAHACTTTDSAPTRAAAVTRRRPSVPPRFGRHSRLTALEVAFRRFRICLALIAATTAFGVTGLRAAEKPAVFQEELLGIVVAKREVATLLVLEDKDRFWLPLEEIAPMISIEIISTRQSEGVRIKTPYGEVAIAPAHVKRRRDGIYVDQRFFQNRLNTHMRFDEEASTLELRPPWHAFRGGQRPDDLPELVPEVRPPSYGLATIHGETYYETLTD